MTDNTDRALLSAGAVPPTTQEELETPSLTEGALTKRLEGVVRRLMTWCDCGGDGCDLCHSAKTVTQAALMVTKLQQQLHAAQLNEAAGAVPSPHLSEKKNEDLDPRWDKGIGRPSTGSTAATD